MTHPTVLCVLLNFRTPEMTLRAAEAALADLHPLGGELIIVDNASGDGSFEMISNEVAARGWGEGGLVRVVPSAVNGGFGAGNNIGLSMVRSDGQAPDYYYVLNSDAFPDAGCIAALVNQLEADPKAGFACSHIRGEDDVVHTTAFRFPSIAGEFVDAARLGVIEKLLPKASVPMAQPHETCRVDWSAGASMMIRKSMLDEIGTFDETFFLYFEETDLCLRAGRAGWSCWYVPDSRVVHIGSVSTGMKTKRRMPSYWYDSRRHYFIKNHGRVYALAALLAHLAGGLLHRLRVGLAGRRPQDPKWFLTDLLSHAVTPYRTSPEDLS
ncbi:glycosyltransferase family 2 protein [Sulfitobacter donghicola]|uniref:Glycosyl transferase n=1 Tax=Sulfitobacter donghicola DSW-25 = KCTC 12864 = JCM 14565 TaxID=1300350 RepID=A0A073IFZ0_9RHOB|nr:glycosyltransferase family 2 protein [Sulfitobacter donghicola]KEJ89258.1 glycosyl transferase [Sulfitobacter donghicola DSW-25 = KCTC 12864 = JCM 14565]KIN69054.1 Glycosyl transferase, group 2 family protein [Sulfitobacter donghicola DSW-25 = KCTC 12864 = JCM 14565]